MPPHNAKRFASVKLLERWFHAHHGRETELWVDIAKADRGHKSVTYAEALEVALCFGWIDGQKAKLDAESWAQRFTPRTARSIWSDRNRGIVAALVDAGRMQPAGQAAVDAAKADGRWARAYVGQSKAVVPDDLAQALAASPKAHAFFQTLDSANRYAVLFRIEAAKKPETRQRRIATFVDMLAQGKTLYPARAARPRAKVTSAAAKRSSAPVARGGSRR